MIGKFHYTVNSFIFVDNNALMKRFFFAFLFLFISFVFVSQTITQNIRGTVVDKELRSEIVGAIVSVVDLTESVIATTDEKGNFRLESIPVGRHTLKISYVGYHTVFLSGIMVNSGKETILTVELADAINQMEEVTVTSGKKGEANNDMTSVSSRNFSMDEANRYAGSRGDPARMASNLAGANSSDDSRNDIVIRGNSPAGGLWREEGVKITKQKH